MFPERLSRIPVRLRIPTRAVCRLTGAAGIRRHLVADPLRQQRVGDQMGSNPGGTYQSADGTRWYAKAYRDPRQAFGEHLATTLFRDLGLSVPESVVGRMNGQTVYASQWLPDVSGTLSDIGLNQQNAEKILDGFVADAFTGNWDALGTGDDNIAVHSDGSVSRIDMGGTFLHRAQGSLKPDRLLNDVGEWESLPSYDAYSRVFETAGVDGPDALGPRAVKQIDDILEVRQKAGSWQHYVDSIIPHADPAYRQKLGAVLESRTRWLEQKRAQLLQTDPTVTVLRDEAAAHRKAWDTRGRSERDRPVPIKVNKVSEAIPLILAGHVVELPNVRKVNTLLGKLAKLAKEAKARGEAAPTYDLCKVTVPHTNLFCEKSLGIPRLEMPQFRGEAMRGTPADALPRDEKGKVDAGPEFIDYLESIGIETSSEKVKVSRLMASQSQLDGPRVAKMLKKFDEDGKRPTAPIFISRDNYIIDGHHHWAAAVAHDSADNALGDIKMWAIRVDAPISEVLQRAKAWTKRFGIKPKTTTATVAAHDDSHFLNFATRDEAAAHQKAWDTRGRSTAEHASKVTNATKTHKPSTRRKQQWAKRNEQEMTDLLGGQAIHTDDNRPTDVNFHIGTVVNGIEVKTLLDNSNSKITMHRESRERKLQWAKEHGAMLHTLVIDDRNRFSAKTASTWSGHRLYYRRGVGSFMVPGKLIPIKSAAHLRRLIAADLPEPTED